MRGDCINTHSIEKVLLGDSATRLAVKAIASTTKGTFFFPPTSATLSNSSAVSSQFVFQWNRICVLLTSGRGFNVPSEVDFSDARFKGPSHSLSVYLPSFILSLSLSSDTRLQM